MSSFKYLSCPHCGEKVKKYRNPLPTVDIVIELADNRIVLIYRKNPPHGWALPGGFIDYGESAQDAAIRESMEETGLQIALREILGVYSDPNRDPRFHSLSVVFTATAEGEPVAGDDAADIAVFAPRQIPQIMAFDHRKIVDDYLQIRNVAWRRKKDPEITRRYYMNIKHVAVIGAGTMGNGIAQVCAQAGCNVIMRDIDDTFVKKGLKNIDRFLSIGVEKGKITADDKNSILGRIKGTTNMDDCRDADIVIEAVIEDIDLKKQVFKQLEEITGIATIFATNTSSMSITEIASATSRPDKVVGMHFFNPVPLMKLVEIIHGYHTSDQTVEISTDFAKKLGKTTVDVKKDSPGFLVNRVMIPHLIEAIKIVEEGIASPEDVDTAVKNGLNYPMGPFELMDLTGIDICYFVNEYFYKELNKESKWVSPNLMKTMVRANRLGRKTKAGWYDYGE